MQQASLEAPRPLYRGFAVTRPEQAGAFRTV